MHQRQHRQTSALEAAACLRCDMCLRPGLELRQSVVVVGLEQLEPRWLCDECLTTADDGHDAFVHVEVLDGRRASAA